MIYHEMTHKEILASLPDDETVLWASFKTSPVSEFLSLQGHKYSHVAYSITIILSLFVTIVYLYRLLNSEPGEIDLMAVYLVVVFLCVALTNILLFIQSLQSTSQKTDANSFSNAIVTSARFILYNHSPQKTLVLDHSEILSIDSENPSSADIYTKTQAQPYKLLLAIKSPLISRNEAEKLRRHLKLYRPLP